MVIGLWLTFDCAIRRTAASSFRRLWRESYHLPAECLAKATINTVLLRPTPKWFGRTLIIEKRGRDLSGREMPTG